jgi:type IV secretion system protein VirB4
LGGSYKNLTSRFNGAYLSLGLDTHSATINPFTLPPSGENVQFLFSFVKVLLHPYTTNPSEERELFEQIENLYVLEPEHRRLLTLSNMLNRRLRGALQRWVKGGQYGGWFDHGEDNLTFSTFQTFDFAGMDKFPDVLEPLLFYILHRASAAIQDPALGSTFKVFVVDEAWRFLRHPAIRLYMTEALKTWRKLNASMILATQSSDDLLHSEMLGVAVESAATKMFLANPDIDRALYREIFHLNETETDWITRLMPKQQILIKRPDFSKVVNLIVSPKEVQLYTGRLHDSFGGQRTESPIPPDLENTATCGLTRRIP